MTAYQKIIFLLDQNKVWYKELRHKPVLTSEEAFAVRPDISLSQGAKALIISYKNVKKEKNFAMIVLPGDKKFESKKLKKILKAKELSFAKLEEVIKITKGVLPGGVPPFGNIFGLKTYVDSSLKENETIAFNAGDRSISIVMHTKDYFKLNKPETISDISK